MKVCEVEGTVDCLVFSSVGDGAAGLWIPYMTGMTPEDKIM